MAKIGKTDAFERRYTQKFRAFAGEFGEFVFYERDRGVRDIGLHLTRKLKSGEERLSASLCWCQLKGIMADTLPLKDYKNKKEISIRLETGHLQYWYLQPMPTYLVVYIESVDTFLIADIQKYVEERWGASILEVESATTTVKLPRSNVLDEQVFDLILDQNEREQWEKAIDCDHEAIRHIQRDYNLIWHIGTASDRGVRHEMEIRDWQSKTRGELFIAELADEGERTLLRSHVQFMLPAAGVEHAYPYLQLSPIVDDDTDEWFSDEDDEEYTPELELGDGSRVSGVDCSGEYFEYTVSVKLNELGTTLFEFVVYLEKVGLIEIVPGQADGISLAPWNARSV